MTRDLSRLFRPKSIAIIGGGAWCASVIDQCHKMGFSGEIWRVHPKGGEGIFRSVNELPKAPDAAFVGVNRFATIDVVQQLSALNAGGAVCFASGFSEAAAEDDQHEDGRCLHRGISEIGDVKNPMGVDQDGCGALGHHHTDDTPYS